MTTLAEGRDAALSLVTTAWNATGAASAGVPLQFGKVKADQPGELATATAERGPWARASVTILDARQSTQGVKRFLTEALLTVQIFTAPGDGGTLSDSLSTVVLNALRDQVGNVDGIWFANVRPESIDEGQVNVLADFSFQERR